MTWGWSFPQTYKTYGGYPLFAIVTVLDGVESVFRQSVRSDKAFVLARSVWKNNQPLDEVWVVNQMTGNRRDVISRDTCSKEQK